MLLIWFKYWEISTNNNISRLETENNKPNKQKCQLKGTKLFKNCNWKGQKMNGGFPAPLYVRFATIDGDTYNGWIKIESPEKESGMLQTYQPIQLSIIIDKFTCKY